MCARWTDPKKNRFDPEVVINRLLEYRTLDEYQNPSFDAFAFDFLFGPLEAAISISPEFGEVRKQAIIQDAIFRTFQAPTVTPEDLLNEVTRIENAFLKDRPSDWVLLTSISVEHFDALGAVELNGCHIAFYRYPPSEFDREDAVERSAHTLSAPLPSAGYSTVLVRVSSRTPEEAAEQAQQNLHTLRGIWNLPLIRGRFRVSAGPRSGYPLNELTAGPIYTIHHPSGRMASGTFWLEPGYSGPRSSSRARQSWPHVRRFQRWALKRLARIPYRLEIEVAFARYAKALDEPDYDSALVRLWSILELLTDTKFDRYTELIKRVVFIYADRKIERQILQHLMESRNRLIHADAESKNGEALVCSLRRYVEQLLLFHLSSGPYFKSLAEVGEFLSLPADKELITRRKNLLARAQRFLGRQERALG